MLNKHCSELRRTQNLQTRWSASLINQVWYFMPWRPPFSLDPRLRPLLCTAGSRPPPSEGSCGARIKGVQGILEDLPGPLHQGYPSPHPPPQGEGSCPGGELAPPISPPPPRTCSVPGRVQRPRAAICGSQQAHPGWLASWLLLRAANPPFIPPTCSPDRPAAKSGAGSHHRHTQARSQWLGPSLLFLHLE